MGLAVRTGQIVWNEVKEELTDDDNDTILIHNSNISKDNKFEIMKISWSPETNQTGLNPKSQRSR